MTSTPSEGWYQDPSGQSGLYRYWNGGAWTEHTYDAATAAARSQPRPQWQQPPYPHYGQYAPIRPPLRSTCCVHR